MLRMVFKLLLCILLLVILISCSKDNKDDVYKDNMAMSYMVKKASGMVDLSNDWNAGQWKHANILELQNYMGNKPEHFPKTQAKLLYDDENLYVFFRVEDQYIRAVADRIHGRVCRDSCVEFFFTPDAELADIYFNLETNCGGTMLFRYNDKNNSVEKYVDLEDCKKIKIYHSQPEIISEEVVESVTWTLSYKLPFEVIAKYSKMTKPQTGVTWKANFYKCADKTSHPHWLTWSFIDNPTPNFHLPQFFGELKFE